MRLTASTALRTSSDVTRSETLHRVAPTARSGSLGYAARTTGDTSERRAWHAAVWLMHTRSRLSAAAIDRYCREARDLASFKRPRRVVFVREIPKTASGKILRRLLRDGQYAALETRPEGDDE